MLCWFCEYLTLIPLWFTESLRVEKFPSHSSPLFYRTLGHSRNFIYIYIYIYILFSCLFSQTQWKPVCNNTYIYIYIEGSDWVFMDNVLDCIIVVGAFNHQSRYHVHFRPTTFWKDINSLTPYLWFELSPSCSSAKMTLALNNPRRLIFQ